MTKQIFLTAVFSLLAMTSFSQQKEVSYKDGEQLLNGVAVSPKKPKLTKQGF